MSAIDIESLTSPLSAESPAGEDLEYDLSFQELDEVAKGTPDRVIRVKDPENAGQEIDRVVPGEEPDAKAMQDKATALFQRTRDLRVAVRFCYALTKLYGLPGLADGLAVIAGLLANLWDDVHPRLQADDGFDPFFRINVLSSLADAETLIKAVRSCPFVESRAVGRFTLRDIEVAKGDLSPLEGQSAPSFELFRAALQESDADARNARQTALESALQSLARVTQIFKDHEAGSGPDLGTLQAHLRGALEVFAATEAADPDFVSGASDSLSALGAPLESQQGGGGGRLSTRSDARRQLEVVAEFMERNEPAHPAPIFIRRAIALLDMSFLEIVQDLTPEAMQTVCNLGGIRDK